MYFLSWIIVGLIMGWVTRKLLKEGGYGPIVDVAMCIAGAIAGGFIVRVASFPGHGGLVYSTLVAILGAVILRAWVASLASKRFLGIRHVTVSAQSRPIQEGPVIFQVQDKDFEVAAPSKIELRPDQSAGLSASKERPLDEIKTSNLESVSI